MEQHLLKAKERPVSIQTYARIAGVMFLMAIAGGGFGEAYAPSAIIVSGNAPLTAHNVIASNLLFRLGFLGYLIEAITDVALTLLLYVVLRPVHANLAKLAVLFRIMATATFAFGELFYFMPSLTLGGETYLKAFSPDQLQVLALLSLNLYVLASGIFNVFYGIASLIFGFLMLRSGYLPWIVGALWVFGGLGFVSSNILLVLTGHASSYLPLPQVLAVLLSGLWLLVRGVDVEKWKICAAR